MTPRPVACCCSFSRQLILLRRCLGVVIVLFYSAGIWQHRLVRNKDGTADPLTHLELSTIQQSPLRPVSSVKLKPTISKSQQQLDRIKRLSSVDYMACCGLGHRLTKMSDAHYVAKKLNLAFRSYWGYCDETEVFHYLFGQQPLEELVNVSYYDQSLRLNNDVKGFRVLVRGDRSSRSKNDATCQCSFDKMQEDFNFYQSLRQRFRFRQQVDAFRQQHFDGKLVVGIHIRGGNGETGDFQKRGRQIDNVNQWMSNLAQLLISKVEWKNATLFVAADTLSMIGQLQNLLQNHMTFVHWEQIRPESGKGVLFGLSKEVIKEGGVTCLDGWVNAVSDMILLSYANVVIAARPSSFTQSMPLSLVLGGTSTKSTIHGRSGSFCEMNWHASEMQCYHSMKDWCCQGTTRFSMGVGMKQYHDYINVPPPISTILQRGIYSLQNRADPMCTPRPKGWKQVCLPYDWSDFRIETNNTVTLLTS